MTISCFRYTDNSLLVHRVLIAQFACIALAFRPPRLNTNTGQLNLTLPKRTHYAIQYTLAILTTVSLLVTLYRAPKAAPQPHRPASRIARAGIWTVHFGIDNEGRDSQRLMRDLIRCVVVVLYS